MPTTECQGSPSSYTSSGRSIFGIRRNQVHSMEESQEAFQKNVAERLNGLLSDELLSIPWITKLVDVFLNCQDEFRSILVNNKSDRAPIERSISDYFERSVKGLDVFNVIRDGIDRIKQWQKLLEIVLCAFDNQRHRGLGEGQFHRAKKALIDLAISMLDHKGTNSVVSHRNRSFGRNNAHKDCKNLAQFRSLSWSVSQNWSASKQLQSIGNNLAAPRGNDIVASNGLALAVYTMSYVLYFVMWALVAAIPCQDRGLQAHFHVSSQFLWSGPILSVHDRILEESKKKYRKNTCGLLKEIHGIEKCARYMNELIDTVQFPLSDEKEGEVRRRVDELKLVCESLKIGLDPLERQVREAFHKIVLCRIDSMGQANHQ